MFNKINRAEVRKLIREEENETKPAILMVCGVLGLVGVLLLPVAQAQVPFIPTDQFGNLKTTFLAVDNVYITGGDCKEYGEVSIYIIPNRMAITVGNSIVGPVNASTVDNYRMKTLPTTLIWHYPLIPGEFDVWIDVNQNGVYDAGIDNYQAFCIFRAFLVVPESLLGPIGMLSAMIAGLSLFSRKSRSVKVK